MVDSTTILVMPRPDGGRRPAAGEDKPASGTDGSMSISRIEKL